MGHNSNPLVALSPAWERDFLFHSMTFHTANAFDTVCLLDRDDILQKVASGFLLDEMRAQNFAGPLSPVASNEYWDQSVVIVLLTFCHM